MSYPHFPQGVSFLSRPNFPEKQGVVYKWSVGITREETASEQARRATEIGLAHRHPQAATFRRPQRERNRLPIVSFRI